MIEEAAKGLFLLLMMTGVRRNELNSLTDCLVYAGVTAVGFAWLENIFYIADGTTLADSLLTAGMRLVMGPFAHPLFTTFTAIGVYFALQQRNWLKKAGCVLIGYVAAVIMHGLWNGSALLGAGRLFRAVFRVDDAGVRTRRHAGCAQPSPRAAHRCRETARDGRRRSDHAG